MKPPSPRPSVATVRALGERVKAGRETDDWMRQVRIPGQKMVLFTRQLATLFEAGVPIAQALESLTMQAEEEKFAEVIFTVNQALQAGHYLSQATSLFPRVFPRMYSRMLRVGETSGFLGKVLHNLADWMERDQRIWLQARSAFTYPGFVLLFAVILILVLFTQVLPPLLSVLTGMNVPLPWYTQAMVLLAKGLRHPGVWVGSASLAILAGAAFREAAATERGAREIFRFAVSIPVLGRLIKIASLARYATAAEVMLGSGGDYLQAWQLAGESCGNPLLAEDARELTKTIAMGETVSSHMDTRPDLYSRILVQMVRGGEETSTIPDMMNRLRTFFDAEVDFQVEAIGSIIEPLLLLFVAGVVGSVLLSIFVPLYSHLSSL